MKRIIFGSLRNELIQDMQVGHVLGNYDEEYELKLVSDPDNIAQDVADWHPDLVVLSYEMLLQQDAWKFGDIQVAYVAKDRNDLNLGATYGLKTLGIASSASEILEKLKKEPYDIEKQAKPASGEHGQKDTPKAQGKDIQEQEHVLRQKKQVEAPAAQSVLQSDAEEDDYDDLYALLIDTGNREPEDTDEQEKNTDSPDAVQEPEQTVEPEPEPEPVQRTVKTRARTAAKEPDIEDVIEEEFKKDTARNKGKTKVVTVYSAKGGVGKTTIATELALYLSQVSVGRGKLRVCLVDYNIDFGDVKGTLALKDEGPNLTYWADEIQEFLANGKKPEEIVYDKEGVEEWLRIYKDTGLYVLPAPLTNEDSMGIETDSLDIILNNIIQNGEFDFVICDTGNNTRDSTMIALEHADTILLIMTQNVNTAFCDRAFMETMKSIDFDLSNTKLVINYIMPKKSTGITVQEIVEYFPYECVGKLRFNTDVITATNLGLPLSVNDPGSEFISQMRSIVAYLLKDNDFEVQKKQRKRLFGFLGKR